MLSLYSSKLSTTIVNCSRYSPYREMRSVGGFCWLALLTAGPFAEAAFTEGWSDVRGGIDAWWDWCVVGFLRGGIHAWWDPCVVGFMCGGIHAWWSAITYPKAWISRERERTRPCFLSVLQVSLQWPGVFYWAPFSKGSITFLYCHYGTGEKSFYQWTISNVQDPNCIIRKVL